MNDLLLHVCCGPCATVAVPAWRQRGFEPLAWFHNPNVQPAAEHERRREALLRYGRAAGLEIVEEASSSAAGAWREWSAAQAAANAEERCGTCLRLRLEAAAESAARLGMRRFSTTLSVSPYQRHDLIEAAGEAAGDLCGVAFVYLDLRDDYPASYAESRRFGLYRQPYCGCVASKWEAWQERRARRRAG